MASAVVDGKVLDFKYKKVNGFIYSFYIGDLYMGKLFKMGEGAWSCMAKESHPLSPLNGFKSRYYASECILKMNGIYRKDLKV